MAGIYAHCTAMHMALYSSHLQREFTILPQAVEALKKYSDVCRLGAISPDMPAFVAEDAAKHTEGMHQQVRKYLTVGVKALASVSSREAQDYGFAWLAGYASHAILDATIHPAINLMVGPYASKSTEHALCEAYQDIYALSLLQKGDEFAWNSIQTIHEGLNRCGKGELHPLLREVWKHMLMKVNPSVYPTDPAAKIETWYAALWEKVEQLNKDSLYAGLSRHIVLANPAIIHPQEFDSAAAQYTNTVRRPGRGFVVYDIPFNTAVRNIQSMWSDLSRAVYKRTFDAVTIMGDYNLDTGKTAAGVYEFW